MNKNRIYLVMMLLVFTGWSTHGFGEAACKICGGWGHASAYGRLFDPKSVETITGEVLSVSKISPMDTEDYGLSFLLDTGRDEVYVHLGPSWYVESEAMKFEGGDIVEVTGSKVMIEGDPAIVVTEVRKGKDVMILRSKEGQPAWSGWKKK